MIANAAWLLEFVLAAFGCWFFFQRDKMFFGAGDSRSSRDARKRVVVQDGTKNTCRFTPLWTWLGFRALADVVCFLALYLCGSPGYAWADYLQRQAQYALIALVSVYTVSQVLREHPKTRRAYLWLLGAMACLSVLLFHAGLPSAAAVLKFEIWAEITLSGFVALAMGTANGKAPRPWGLIAIALVTLGSSDLLVTALRLRGFRAEGIYPVGEILGLAILAWAGWKDWKCEEVRLPLPKKKPPTSVGSPEILEMFGG